MNVQPRFDLTADALRKALAGAEPQVLLMVLVHLTGDQDMLRRYAPFIGRAREFSHSIPADMIAVLHDRLIAVLDAYAGQTPALSSDLYLDMMSTCVGEKVPPRYLPMFLQDMGLSEAEKNDPARSEVPRATARPLRIVVIGAGASGICAGIKLKEAGFDFEIFERNGDVGGVWQQNVYPGCGVDTANHLYCYSFALNHRWSRYYVRQDELRGYLADCADRHDLRDCIKFNTEVLAVEFDAGRKVWRGCLRDASGAMRDFEADVVIGSVGQLNQPSIPAIEGLADFAGRAVHTAQWDPSIDVTGRRVAIVGTGASGIQVGPAIAPDVASLTVFQRSPPWVQPRHNFHRTVSEETKWVLENVPYYAIWYRFFLFWAFGDGLHDALQKDPAWTGAASISKTNDAIRTAWTRYIEQEVGDDPALLAKVVPDYPPYGKRSLKDTHWYRMLKQPHVDLVTTPIARVTATAIETTDGREHLVDTIIFATGFHASRMLYPIEIRGRTGKTIRDLWGDDDPRAYLGITVPEFPNLFLTYGPNTNLGHGGNILFNTECQVRYIVKCLMLLRDGANTTMECRQDVHDAYNARVDAAHEKMVWTHPTMTNWYKNKQGRVTTNSPWKLIDYWEMTNEPRTADFIFG